MTDSLCDYLRKTVIRGACTCGRCADAPDDPELHQPAGHTSDVFFFKVSANDGCPPDKDSLLRLIEGHQGDFCDCNPLDGKEHGYMELGGWIGDQGMALMMMGIGEILGIWKVMTPKMLPVPEELQQQMAGAGMVSIVRAE